MPETLTDEPALSWPAFVAASGAAGHSPLETVIADEILPRLSAVNRPTKTLDTSGIFWTPLKSRGVKGAKVSDRCRIYTREGKVIGGRDGDATSLTSDLAERILLTKSSVKQHLASAGLPVPDGRVFAAGDGDGALAYAKSLQGPAVVKPNGRTSGAGVSTEVHDESRFRAAWRSAVAAATKAEPPRPWDPASPAGESGDQILVEPHDAGLALRVFVTGESVLGAVVRLPMFVVGDGIHSLGELIEELNTWRDRHVLLRRLTPRESVMEGRLRRLELTPETILTQGQVCRLQEGPSVQRGGLSLDVTDRLDPAIRELAVEARWAIPAMFAAGIDISVPRISSSTGVVIGVNDRASQHLHLYPTFGASRNLARGIVDQFIQRA
ncbi:hypothetical protein [Nesterenkonia sandarakina]|uniref:D-alanine-D-alanine ligase-like ATP-grasp enzyme n=1 Tax=Nesterenkonia sandarakina TaxID=272918 RepID=A0A7Z0EA44_9MICC|nr:hypothetical protein [Nesterenkonia sandarakina]NYJ17876.1 D-alanine-D-alanine ligase-like ATP-grasp enzyme [Nesterenkonia sandarakina]